MDTYKEMGIKYPYNIRALTNCNKPENNGFLGLKSGCGSFSCKSRYHHFTISDFVTSSDPMVATNEIKTIKEKKDVNHIIHFFLNKAAFGR